MTFAYISAADLPIQVERQQQPLLRERPVVVLSHLAEPAEARAWRSDGRQVVEAASDDVVEAARKLSAY